jgi:prepilin-type N-terminal cleavage/methylation domain-containing protein
MAPRPLRPRRTRRGFTLVELLITMVVGVIVLGIGTNFALTTWRSQRRARAHDTLARDARYLGMAISRDVQDAGVSFESMQDFGALATRNDTVMTLSVPFDPQEAPVYPMVAPNPASPNPLPPGGTCGPTCISFRKVDGAFRIGVGDVARLQVDAQRRLIVVNNVNDRGASVDVTFLGADTLFTFPAAFAGGIQLPHSGVSLQRVIATGWYRQGTQLFRVTGWNTDGSLRAQPVASGVEAFEARMRFTNGVERAAANGTNADTLDDYNRITSIRIRAEIRTDSAGLNMPNVLRRYEWRITPRNLVYERNRTL